MKKFVFLAVTVAIAAACTMEILPETTPSEPANNGSYIFTLNACSDNLTKTSYAGEQTFSWTAGDQISVLFHNGDDNKFFTLTTSSSGANVTFSGTIDTGYEIGASDGEHEKIAFFPAGAHSYTAGQKPVFNIPALTDFTKSHFSANLPMAAKGDGDNNFAFKHISGAYKVVFTDIDNSVKKVKLHVKNQVTRAISGDFTMQDGGSHIYVWWWTSAAEGSMEQTLSYVENVVDGKATFYIPYCHNNEDFQPVLTLTNAANGYTLKKVSAKAGFSGTNKASYDRVVVLPNIPASGTGTAPAWVSGHGINWDMVETVTTGRADSPYNGINLMKATADAGNLYVFLDIKAGSSYLLDNDTYDYANYCVLYAGDGTSSGSKPWMWSTYYQTTREGWLKTGNSVAYTVGTGAITDYTATVSGDHCYYEIAYPRTGNTPLLGTTAYIGFTFDKRYRIGSDVYTDPSLGSTCTGFAPTTEDSPRPDMLRVTMPMYSAAPATASSPIDQSYTEATGEVSSAERGMMSYSKFTFENDEIPTVKSIPLDYTGESLAFLLFYLTDYMNKDLDAAALKFISDEFDKVRVANKKAIVRFAYTETYTENTQHEATPTQVLKHIDQIADIITANADIIYLIQAGWLGTYGEWYYKTKNHGETVDDYDDYYLYTVSGSAVTDLNNNHKKLLDKMLATTPAPIQIGLRTAFYKRYYLSPGAIGSWTEITDWGTSSNHRLAFFNDGIRGSASDVGTFDSSTDRTMWYSQGNWTACGGEMSYRSAEAFAALSDDLKDCDEGIAEMRRQHLSYLHYSESNRFMVKWIGEGRMEDIKKALGYRLVLNSANFTFDALTSGQSVNYTISLQNTGCAPVIYSRPFKLVVIHDSAATVLVDDLMDIRNLSAGASATELTGSFELPFSLSVGDKLALWLPDPDPLDNGLDENPAYSMRFANSDVTWSDGYNVIYTF
ncbi:MAG: DUF4832 domain-containing protein [Bacteroidales bacterium]|nr:DUF4832 domain-containing protein [Bacteroidales bacterium]